jgi:SsrA-binding protein
MKNQQKLIAQNKKARHDFEILDTSEAGIVLLGSEVKSCRMGRANLKDSYARIENGEILLIDAHISHCPYANRLNHEPLRKRKLLFHKGEIKRLYGKIREKGLAFIPLKMYFKENGKVKVEMALAKGKKMYDHREDIRKKDLRREAERGLKIKN